MLSALTSPSSSAPAGEPACRKVRGPLSCRCPCSARAWLGQAAELALILRKEKGRLGWKLAGPRAMLTRKSPCRQWWSTRSRLFKSPGNDQAGCNMSLRSTAVPNMESCPAPQERSASCTGLQWGYSSGKNIQLIELTQFEVHLGCDGFGFMSFGRAQAMPQ